MNTIENGSLFRQPDSVNGFIEESKARIYSRLLELDDTSLKILKVVAESKDIQSSDLQKKVNLTRAPVLQRTKKMSEEKLLSRSIVPGTETHSKPTYRYSLPQSITVIAVSCAIARLSVTAYLEAERNGSTQAEVPKKSLEVGLSRPSFQAFEIVQELLETAFQKIADLEGRLARVEEALHQPSTFDREKLLNILSANKE